MLGPVLGPGGFRDVVVDRPQGSGRGVVAEKVREVGGDRLFRAL